MCPPAIRSSVIPDEGTVRMIVIGADTHKHSHTVGAVEAATGRELADKTVKAKRRSFDDLLGWARGLGAERVWAIEDCRHVSGALERFLLRRGERVVRVAPKLMAGARRSARERGKSDVIDAVAIARAALRESIDELPVAQLAGPELDRPPAGRSPRAPRRAAHRADQRPALAPSRPVARIRDPRPRTDRRPLAGPRRRAPSTRRTDRARADRARRAAAHPRAHQIN
jgi:Transposase